MHYTRKMYSVTCMRVAGVVELVWLVQFWLDHCFGDKVMNIQKCYAHIAISLDY